MKMDVRKMIGGIAFFLALGAMQNANAATWYVATTGNDSNAGTQASPFLTIGHGVSVSASGDTVLVADGKYTGAGNYNMDFGGKDRTVQSVSGNAANCIIDCFQRGRAFTLQSGETQNSLISGFTIENGSANGGGGIYISTNNVYSPVVSNCIFTSNYSSGSGNNPGYGGGLYGGTANNCTFNSNSANEGGGIYNSTANNCTFNSNSAYYYSYYNSSYNGYGGGMIYGTSTGCAFNGNYSPYQGGGLYGGSATSCTFTGNSANYGGGMLGGGASNCTFTNNNAFSTGGSPGYGGGMYYGGTITNCIFMGNSANQGGGFYGGTAINCTFTSNSTYYYSYYNSSYNGLGGGMINGPATGCTFNSNYSQYQGGGMYGSTATSCTFNGNAASTQGGGMLGGTANYCTFTANSCPNGGGMYGGGANYCNFTGNSLTMNNAVGAGYSSGTANYCVFYNNSILGTNGNGAGMYGGSANNCVFTDNLVTNGSGGGMVGGTATNSIFTGNYTSVSGGGMQGGAATDCVFNSNSARYGGGAEAVSLYFCTVYGNTALTQGGGTYLSKGTITDSIIWGNTAPAGPNLYDDGTSGAGAVTYSDVQGGTISNGNIASDPKFVKSATGNLHLSATSPCINVGTTTAPAGFALPTTDCDNGKRFFGTAPDMGAYEYGGSTITGTITFDGISSKAIPQFVTFQFRPNGSGTLTNLTYPATSDGAFYLNGVPNGSYMMWAQAPIYLSSIVPVTILGTTGKLATILEPGDSNSDNIVNTTDFNTLVNVFGNAYVPGIPNSASGYDPTADFNGDGVIDTADFNLLIGNFGNSGAP